MDNPLPPQTIDEYMTCFRQLAAITAAAMDFVERTPPITLSALDRIAQNVETLASLRGDSGIYDTTRPPGLTSYQSELYATENVLRARLLGLGYSYPPPRALSETA
ncbi:MAG: hypothetical protein JWN38_977 [Candidatus Saccharibacteria bacterium]|nr:hypothetical protein [Candidatus Saccharibacteria bacterium]